MSADVAAAAFAVKGVLKEDLLLWHLCSVLKQVAHRPASSQIEMLSLLRIFILIMKATRL